MAFALSLLGPALKWLSGILYDLLKTAMLTPDKTSVKITSGPIKAGFSDIRDDDILRKHGGLSSGR